MKQIDNHPSFPVHLISALLASAAFFGCASHGDQDTARDPIQDMSSILQTFEEVRAEFDLPKTRLGLQATEIFAYAGEGSHLVIDEQFASELSDAALRYVLVHEFSHLKNKDPKNGHDILKRLHQEQGGTGDTRFLTLLGIHGQHPDFQAYVIEAERRANQAAIEYTRGRGDDPCDVVREIETKTKTKFPVGVDTACTRSDSPAPMLDEQAAPDPEKPEQDPALDSSHEAVHTPTTTTESPTDGPWHSDQETTREQENNPQLGGP